MEEKLSRCDFRCDLCIAYRLNIESHLENRQLLSDGWFKYFGFRIQPENILCDGCLNNQCNTLDQECTFRPCVVAHGIENCARCLEYACEKIKERLVSFEAIQARFTEPISEDDRNRFIRPYENKNTLDAIRQQSGNQ